MIRIAATACLLLTSAMPAAAVSLLGDFECLSDLGGPDTYHGTMRVEDPTQFGFLNDAAEIADWYPLDISNPAAVRLDDAFAEHISAGATVVSARELEGEFTYSVTIRTRKGDETEVICTYVY